MIRYLIIFLLTVMNVSYSWADKGGRQNNKPFLSLYVGQALGGNADTAPPVVKDKDEEWDIGTGGSGVVGYKWGVFSLEALYTIFGTSEANYNDYYKEKHSPFFLGGGLHWTFSFFDLKLGFGTGNDRVTYTQGPNSTTFTTTPSGGKSSGAGTYFGFGFNINLSPSTEFLIDYTGYNWAYSDSQTITVNGDTKVTDKPRTSMGMLSLGIRRFF